MWRAIAARLLLVLPVTILLSFGTFILIDLVPGDPALHVVGPNATVEDYQRVRDELGLDQPLPTRYVEWLSNAVRGDLGRSLVPPAVSVNEKLAAALPINLQLALMALLIALVIAIPLALVSAYRTGGWVDRAASIASFGLVSVPSFLAGILLILVFSINFGWFPLGQWVRPSAGGWASNLHHAFLPALTLALTEIAVFTRVLRNDLITTLREDFILSARARGIPTRRILVRDALRPSSFSLLTIAGTSLGRLIGGTVIVEQVFSLPGLGRAIIDGARSSDYTIVQGGVLVAAGIYIVLNLGVDVAYAYLDPRVRDGRK